MAGKGGYQAPANPAPVSGPGANSKRTDTGPGDKQPVRAPTGMAYGTHQQMEQLQQQAPLPEAAQGAAGPPPRINPAAADLTSFSAPGDPNAIVTAGSPLGAGPGPEAVAALRSGPRRVSSTLEKYVAADSSGVVAQIRAELLKRGL